MDISQRLVGAALAAIALTCNPFAHAADTVLPTGLTTPNPVMTTLRRVNLAPLGGGGLGC